MSNPYIGEIRIFAGTFAPVGWEFCNGQPMPIAENEALFTLIGTTYGGDGESTFHLPNLQGRIPVHTVGGEYPGEAGGVEAVTLTVQQVPGHSHAATATNQFAQSSTPTGGVLGRASGVDPYNSDPAAVAVDMGPATAAAGGSQPHTNMQPYLCVNFIISLYGRFAVQA